MKSLSVFFVLHIFSLVNTCFSIPKDYKLEQLQVLFRHGDRVPDVYEIYKTDPYDSIYREIGYGQLTKFGKQRIYDFGQILRQRYDSFLGDYKSEDVYAYSSEYDRTKMSLQLILAGLYPPSPKNSWNDYINWSPIPTYSDTQETSFLTPYFCPLHGDLFQKSLKSPKIVSKVGYEKYGQFYEFLKNQTGTTIENVFTVFSIFNNLRAALTLGLPLPSWCSQECYYKLKDISSVYFDTFHTSDLITRVTAGPIVEQFLNNIDGVQKIYLYGGHDLSIASFFRSHNITNVPPMPEYASSIIMEKLRGIDNQVYLRFFFWTGVSRKWLPLNLPYCGTICPLSAYKRIVKPILPLKSDNRCRNTCNQRTTKRLKGIPAEMQLAYIYAGDDLLSFKYPQNFSEAIFT